MTKPTLLIQKRKIYGDDGWTRYHGKEKLNLNYSDIETELQLCKYILNRFGEGHFMVFAWKRGRKGFWVFWKGDIEKGGFTFQRKVRVDTDDIKYLKDELEDESDSDLRELLSKELEQEMEKNKKKAYGFHPWLKHSGRRGDFIYWEDEDNE